MRYVLKIAYDGTAYAGWQRQKNAPTVQQVLEETIFSTLGQDLRVTASGRTDAGVHAAGQVCHFDSDVITVPPEKMPDCLNRFLPPDIRIVEGWGAAESFDSNRSAKRRCLRRRTELKIQHNCRQRRSRSATEDAHILPASRIHTSRKL